jgi:mono/diheme cytochrome c family protein
MVPMRFGRGLRHAAVCCLALIALAAALASCRPWGSAERPAESTERSYELHCLGCHGRKGEGAWGSNIQGLKSPVSEIVRVIAKGEGKMPAYGGHLTEAEITSLAEYVKAFRSGAERAPAP